MVIPSRFSIGYIRSGKLELISRRLLESHPTLEIMRTIAKIFVLCLVALATDAKKVRLSDLAKPASLGEFPYQVAIHLNGNFHCGGALISKTHVLTAAHCVKPMTENPYTLAQGVVVEVGLVRLGSGQSHSVARAAYPGDYSDSPFESLFIPNDIGVLTLQTPVTESANVKVIALPSAGTVVPPGTKVVISGFGSSQPRGPISPILKKDTFKVISKEECNQYYQSKLSRTITSSHICAKSGPGYGTCQGDSGGPLVYNNQVVGVVSGGDGECSTGSPDVYTDVASYLDFIKEQMDAPVSSSSGQGQQVLPPAGNPFQPQLPGEWVIPGYPGFPIYDPYNPYQPQIIYQ
ncbi:hypothetical protein TSAR_016720 [Trichomalopsis sarcophagae]|uniref:Peptidase S1 domain-containing protein n=1 Tax=Trichomalopsis sarcophagae TaxID=543379 RepID=A0A232FI90_9HYME|nr:hypothetical protein TSAR_016720 [Trichomalopsis sarcophagae]